MQTKLCLYMATKRWSRELNSISVDPGTSNETLLNRYTKQDVNFKGTVLRAYNMIRWAVVLPSVENASQTIISAIADPKYNVSYLLPFFFNFALGRIFQRKSSLSAFNERIR